MTNQGSDVLATRLRVRLDATYGDYVKYESLDEGRPGYKTLNGVYILKDALPQPHPQELIVSFDRA